MRTQAVNMTAAAELALQTRRNEQVVFLVAASHNEEQPDIPQEPRSDSPSQSLSVATTPFSGWDWDCVALHETGGDWTMHGSNYSSALGVMNQAVRENASEEVAARILSGTASRQEQIDMAQRIVDRFGIDAWAPSTVAYCT